MPLRGARVRLAASAAVESVARSSSPGQSPRAKSSAILAIHSASVEWPAQDSTPNHRKTMLGGGGGLQS